MEYDSTQHYRGGRTAGELGSLRIVSNELEERDSTVEQAWPVRPARKNMFLSIA